MSRGPWRRCPYTGVPLTRLGRVSEDFLTPEGYFDVSKLADCNVYCPNSIAALSGFADARHFRSVLERPDPPIHVRQHVLRDEFTGEVVAEVIATHVNSANAGGKMWHEMQREAARQRAVTMQSSGQVFRL